MCGFKIAAGEITVCEYGLISRGVGEIAEREINVYERAAKVGVTQVGVSERTMGELGVKVGIEFGLAEKAVVEGCITAELAKTLESGGVKANTRYSEVVQLGDEGYPTEVNVRLAVDVERVSQRCSIEFNPLTWAFERPFAQR
ncbi:hypothetical protein FHS27_006397 [Rhodopirellula rubra]|uniref:Uncharacterized protein n=1 Tax=Aporhodopirellula rubra TaxID=980271 RepID=A0A7W5H9V2_9BACT|nr:hypothetical protein [Aporhodopirellula rubra]MBB3210550.1 hypothetical protein [Aporhodopirellula rubra]